MGGVCTYCRKDMADAHECIGTSDGIAHCLCWHRAHPWENVSSFQAALFAGDMALMRELLCKLVPDDIQAHVVRAFNVQMQIKHDLRLRIYEKKDASCQSAT